jgi:hypothetical protein
VTILTLRLILGAERSTLRCDIADADLQDLLFSTSSARAVLTSRGAYILYLFSAVQVALFLISDFIYDFRFM